jgi:hypothetical protein
LRAVSRKCQHHVYPDNNLCLVPIPCGWKFGTISRTKIRLQGGSVKSEFSENLCERHDFSGRT